MVLSAITLVTACASNGTIEVNYGESISLGAVAGKATCTGSGATTTNSTRNFHVLASAQGATYMDCDVRKQGNIWSYGDTRFWPETDVDFYSYSPTNTRNGNVSIRVEGDKKIANYNIPGDEGLLYALNQAEEKNEHEGKRPVMVNFHHALS